MSPRAARRVAWALWLVALGLLVAGVAIAAPHAAPSEALADVLAFGAVGALLFGPVGAFLATRRPRNPVGWLLAGYGVLLAFCGSPSPTSARCSTSGCARPGRCRAPTGSRGRSRWSGIPATACCSCC
jgi:hypothetical protein